MVIAFAVIAVALVLGAVIETVDIVRAKLSNREAEKTRRLLASRDARAC